jgi:hypothetical protein
MARLQRDRARGEHRRGRAAGEEQPKSRRREEMPAETLHLGPMLGAQNRSLERVHSNE